MTKFDGAWPHLHGEDSVGVRLPLVVKLQNQINKATKMHRAGDRSNLAHATADNEVLQDSEDELLPAHGSVRKQRLAVDQAYTDRL
jgi:hypothetical protein